MTSMSGSRTDLHTNPCRMPRPAKLPNRNTHKNWSAHLQVLHRNGWAKKGNQENNQTYRQCVPECDSAKEPGELRRPILFCNSNATAHSHGICGLEREAYCSCGDSIVSRVRRWIRSSAELWLAKRTTDGVAVLSVWEHKIVCRK